MAMTRSFTSSMVNCCVTPAIFSISTPWSHTLQQKVPKARKGVPRGRPPPRLRRQRQSPPMSQPRQVIALVAALNHVMQDVPLEQMDEFTDFLLSFLEEQAPDLCQRIDRTGLLPQEDREEILTLARKALEQFRQRAGKRGV